VRVLRFSLAPAALIAVIAILMLVFADSLTGVLQTGAVAPTEH
jgi:type IV secretory pathway VirB6-like protein